MVGPDMTRILIGAPLFAVLMVRQKGPGGIKSLSPFSLPVHLARGSFPFPSTPNWRTHERSIS